MINYIYFKKYKADFYREIQDKEIVKYYPNNKNLIKYFSGKMEKENEKLKMKIYKKINISSI